MQSTIDATTDNPKEIWTAILMGVVGLSAFLGMPVIVGALVEGYGLSEGQVGYHSATGMAGGIVAAILVSVLINRANRRTLLLAGLIIGIVSNALSALTSDFNQLLALAFASGIGGGMIYSLGIALLAGTEHTGKNFSILLFAQGVFGGIELFFLPQIAEVFSTAGVFMALAMAFVLMLPLVGFIGKHSQLKEEALEQDNPLPSNKLAPWLALLSVFFFYIAVGSFWTYVERLGVSAKLNSDTITSALTIGNLLALIGCMAAYWLSERVGQAKPLLVGLACLAITFSVLGQNINEAIYLISMFTFFLLWNFIDIFQLGTLSQIGHSGRHVALVPAFQSIGTAIGPALSGALLANGWSLSGIMMLDSITTLIAFILFILVFIMAFRGKKDVGASHNPIVI